MKKLMRQSQLKLKGFTLVEVLVSMSIFILTVTLGVLALTSMSNTSARLRVRDQSVQSAYFLLDSMSRNIRMGTEYKCANDQGLVIDPSGTGCDNLSTIAPGIHFRDQNGQQTSYYYKSDGALYRKLFPVSGGGEPVEEKLHDTYALKFSDGGFIVDGAHVSGDVPDDSVQAYVSVRLNLLYNFRGEDFYTPIQTTLTQRQLDTNGPIQ